MLKSWPQNILNGNIGLVLMEIFQVLHDQYNATTWIYDGKQNIRLQKHMNIIFIGIGPCFGLQRDNLRVVKWLDGDLADLPQLTKIRDCAGLTISTLGDRTYMR